MVKAQRQDADWVNAIRTQKTLQMIHLTTTFVAKVEDFASVMVMAMALDKEELGDVDLAVAWDVV